MKAVGFLKSLPIEHDESLLDVELPDPKPGDDDLLVEVEAVSVNPADAKRRIRTAREQPHQSPLVLGYDAVGTVRTVGDNTLGFRPGDRVWYAGDANRPGSYAELQCVDYRIASLAPSSISPISAASMPLTSITAWELLFDRLRVPADERRKVVLVIGGAGGVGSVTIQILRKLTGHDVVATASRKESRAWCLKMGAHDVVGHRDLIASLRATGRNHADFIVQYADTAGHWDAMCELVAPQGRIGTIVETPEKVDISALQSKSAALVWELMFTRPIYRTLDLHRQGRILARMARLVDDGIVTTTETMVMTGLSAATLKEAHRLIETGAMIGKIVVGFEGTRL